MRENTEKYILPTAAGVFHLVSQKREETPASLLFSNIFSRDRLHPMTKQTMQKIMKLDESEFDAYFEEMQKMNWIEEFDEPLELPEGSVEKIIPQLMTSLSSNGQSLVADEHGFSLFSAGFSDEEIEPLAIMTADLAALYDKYQSVYGDDLLPTQAFSMVDAGGNCHLGVWPIKLGQHNFNLLVKGLPKLNHPNFVVFVWLLYSKYYDI